VYVPSLEAKPGSLRLDDSRIDARTSSSPHLAFNDVTQESVVDSPAATPRERSHLDDRLDDDPKRIGEADGKRIAPVSHGAFLIRRRIRL